MPTPTSSIVEGLDQLSTTSSRSLTPTAEKRHGDEETKEAKESSALQVVYSTQPAERIERKLKVLHGNPPRDEPLEHDVTYSNQDRRSLGPLSIQYHSVEAHDWTTDCTRQDQIVRAVWSHLRDLLPSSSAADTLPAVVFDWLPLPDGEDMARMHAMIVLSFSSVEAFVVVREKLREIQLDDGSNSPITMVQDLWTNTLPGEVLPCDLLRFPVEDATIEEFFATLQHWCEPLGQVLGVGAVMLRASPSSDVSANVIRFYVKINSAYMKLGFLALVEDLATHLRWKGQLYNVCWSGRDLRKTIAYSADYPEELAAVAS